MSWTDEIDRVIEIDHVQIALCLPAGDRGFADFRALWLASAADEPASVIAAPAGRVPGPLRSTGRCGPSPPGDPPRAGGHGAYGVRRRGPDRSPR